MKQAKSMYLGGVLIEATECDFDSSRELGLTCVCCSQAVFLRSGSVRQQKLRNGKVVEQIIAPYFAHYKTSSWKDYDCENRIYSQQGKEQLSQIEIEGKNQRLKLYNKHLWSMFKETKKIHKNHLQAIKKSAGKNFIESLSKAARQGWKKNQQEMSKLIQKKWDDFIDTSEEDYREIIKESSTAFGEKAKEKAISLHKHFKHKCDIRLHLAITQEIADFMTTKTSAYFWLNLVTYVVGTWMITVRDFDRQTIQKECTVKMLLELAPGLIASTPWLDEIQKLLKGDLPREKTWTK